MKPLPLTIEQQRNYVRRREEGYALLRRDRWRELAELSDEQALRDTRGLLSSWPLFRDNPCMKNEAEGFQEQQRLFRRGH